MIFIVIVIFFSRDGSGKPLFLNSIFSWTKRATKGSSFMDLEKNNLKIKLATYSAICF